VVFAAAGVWLYKDIQSGPNEESMMILDVPEMLIIFLTGLLFWLGANNWLHRKH
jgi:hypothetical protein